MPVVFSVIIFGDFWEIAKLYTLVQYTQGTAVVERHSFLIWLSYSVINVFFIKRNKVTHCSTWQSVVWCSGRLCRRISKTVTRSGLVRSHWTARRSQRRRCWICFHIAVIHVACLRTCLPPVYQRIYPVFFFVFLYFTYSFWLAFFLYC